MPSDAAARQFAALSEELTAFRNYLYRRTRHGEEHGSRLRP